jgi:uncharacterized protein YigE (DUF2233 family)
MLPVLVLALSACSSEGGEPESLASEIPEAIEPCEDHIFEEIPLTVCTAIPGEHTIRTALRPERGPPYRSLAAFAADRSESDQPVVFAMNAGMFDDDGDPIGYFVEDSERLHNLNRARGPGNFHLLPNGVFFGSDGAWEVRTSDYFFENVDQRPEFGTQSGPMLVIGGELHPDIDPDGESLRIRNAVGVDSAGRAVFVISDAPISFGRLARFYRDVLSIQNALYLDGTVSALWVPSQNRLDSSLPIGPLIVVEKRANAPVKEDAQAEADGQ